LDDDDDEDNDNNNNGNGNNLQSLVNTMNPVNQWVLPPLPPLLSRKTNTNNNANTNIPKSYQRKNNTIPKQYIAIKKRYIMSLYIIYNIKINKFNLKRIFLLNFRKVLFLHNSTPSTNISSEEMTVTPDMPLSTSDEGSLLNQGEDMYFDVDNEPTESLLVEPETEPLLVEPETDPSRVLPDTGFHFLFSTDETVDLTTKEDNTPKKFVDIMDYSRVYSHT